MATATYVKGDKQTINYTCTGAVVVDEIRVFGSTDAAGVSVGVAQVAGATGDVIACSIEGVYSMPAATGAVIVQGETVNWDASIAKVEDNAHAATAAGDVADFGIAMSAKAAAASATTVVVKLLPGNGAYATG